MDRRTPPRRGHWPTRPHVRAAMYRRHVGDVFGVIHHLVGGDTSPSPRTSTRRSGCWPSSSSTDSTPAGADSGTGCSASPATAPCDATAGPRTGPSRTHAEGTSDAWTPPDSWKGSSGPAWSGRRCSACTTRAGGCSWTNTPRGSRSRRSRPGPGGRPRRSSRCCRGPAGSSAPSCGRTSPHPTGGQRREPSDARPT